MHAFNNNMEEWMGYEEYKDRNASCPLAHYRTVCTWRPVPAIITNNSNHGTSYYKKNYLVISNVLADSGTTKWHKMNPYHQRWPIPIMWMKKQTIATKTTWTTSTTSTGTGTGITMKAGRGHGWLARCLNRVPSKMGNHNSTGRRKPFKLIFCTCWIFFFSSLLLFILFDWTWSLASALCPCRR